MKPKISKADQTAHTRTALLRAGRTLFADQGYANTPTESIVRRAGVTRGALARLVWGALLEAALHIAYTDDGDATQEDMRQGLEQLIAGLRIEPLSQAEGN